MLSKGRTEESTWISGSKGSQSKPWTKPSWTSPISKAIDIAPLIFFLMPSAERCAAHASRRSHRWTHWPFGSVGLSYVPIGEAQWLGSLGMIVARRCLRSPWKPYVFWDRGVVWTSKLGWGSSFKPSLDGGSKFGNKILDGLAKLPTLKRNAQVPGKMDEKGGKTIQLLRSLSGPSNPARRVAAKEKMASSRGASICPLALDRQDHRYIIYIYILDYIRYQQTINISRYLISSGCCWMLLIAVDCCWSSRYI